MNLTVAHAAGNSLVLDEARLRRTFEDGGTISSFAVERQSDGVFLVRMGRDRSGRYRSEWIPLIQRGPGFGLIASATWFYVCDSTECSTCHPNTARTDCECTGGSTCNFGIEQGLFPTEVLGS